MVALTARTSRQVNERGGEITSASAKRRPRRKHKRLRRRNDRLGAFEGKDIADFIKKTDAFEPN
jgi:hypothetical protein